MIRFTAENLTIEAAEGDSPRTITGLAVPYGVDAVVSGGQRVRILEGAIVDGPAPRLLAEHDPSRVIGIVTGSENTPAGMRFSAQIAPTTAGNDILELLKMGAYDSVSVGLRPIEVEQEGATTVVRSAQWEELSVVYAPAFAQAKVETVTASAEEVASPDNEPQQPSEEETMSDPIIEPAEAPETVEAAAPAVVPSAPIYAQPKKFSMPSFGDYIHAMREGGHRWHTMNEQIRAATGDVVTSDASIPVPVLGGIYQDIDARRPIVSALGVRSMPEQGSTFKRPKVNTHSAVGEQSSELAGLTSANFDLTSVTFTKVTFGGTLKLSEQVIDMSSPSMLDAAVSDLATEYALQTEKYAVDQLAAAVTNTQEVIVTDITDATEVIGDIYTAAASIAATGNYLPNALLVSPAKWAALGSLVDGSGRPVFPQVSPLNGIGTLPGGATDYTGNPLGLRLVVSNQIGTQAVGNKTATEYLWLVNTRGIEYYEAYKGFASQSQVATLAVDVVVRGYVACEVIDVNMVRFLGPDATFS